MKKILVPTDFSENADKALDFALALANKFNAKLRLVHTYNTSAPAGHLGSINRVVKEDREKEMAAFVKATQESISFDLDIKGRCKKGYPVEMIESEAERIDADLIIMGTLGASNLSKQVMGSTASKLIKHTQFPVLAIPRDTHYSDIKNIVVAVDALTMSVLNTLNPMIDIAQKSNLNIELVHVSNQQIHTDIDPTIKEYLNGLAVPFNYTKIQSDQILESILTFAHEKGNSVLCLVSRQRGWFENLFHSSVSQQVALKSDLPLLILQDQNA
ncbi:MULTISPECIES: universal stress protein [unclassified Aureispira]|uniref:universal stress protein n=1 Tax=unclassified Aureispira TaxID=2649989 RepID=UPI000697B202|nr:MULTISPECIES: universal stress protein [unclassified Aureispira]WMX15510.1 universal stress protein [Aureispira sp. CCB-E]